MARVVRQDDLGKLLGYLDDPRCHGPLPPRTQYVEFPAWRLRPDLPWQHRDPGPPEGLHRPHPVKMIFQIQVTNIANQEIALLLQHDEVDFIKAHPAFRAP